MKISNNLICAAGVLLLLGAFGCGSGSSDLTKEKEAQIRNPKADPNYKGPSADDTAKMNASIDEYRKKHANDVVKFK